MAEILILEDADDSFEIEKQILLEDHNLQRAKSVQEAKELFSKKYDLVIVDVVLPDGDGFEFCHWVRFNRKSNTPIVFVSGKNTTESCVAGLTIGGDDYIYKPFHPSEFLARINSKIKLHSKRSETETKLEYNDIFLDLASQKAYISENGNKVELSLTPIEFKILQIFLQSPGKAICRDKILDEVWGKEVYVYPRSVDTHVSKLRKKLFNKGELIASVHGMGYRLLAKEEVN